MKGHTCTTPAFIDGGRVRVRQEGLAFRVVT
jgi:hypothetical protein